MKIAVVGGTGLVGQGILLELSKDTTLELHSISRNGKRPNSIAGVNYHSFDLAHDTSWHSLLQTSDWVIDCVGILLPNKSKNQTYENSSIEPAKLIIDSIANFDNKFLFISANSAPFFLNNYLHAKRTVENYASRKLGNRAISVYPGLVYSKFRRSNYYLAVMLDFLLKFKLFSFLRKYRPISRERFAKEIRYIIEEKNSELTYRIK